MCGSKRTDWYVQRLKREDVFVRPVIENKIKLATFTDGHFLAYGDFLPWILLNPSDPPGEGAGARVKELFLKRVLPHTGLQKDDRKCWSP